MAKTLSWLVLQIDMNAQAGFGRGTLKPVNCDGHYNRREDALGVAQLMAERFPALATYLVHIEEKL